MEDSNIGWTDHTFNPWIGCTKKSPGCKHCYAEALMDKRYHKVRWGPEGERIRTSETYWDVPVKKWNTDGWLQCTACGWRGSFLKSRGAIMCPLCGGDTRTARQRVFCASLADVFEDRAELFTWRRDLFKLIRETPNLDWLILTKNPENIKPMLLVCSDYDWEYSNIWFGTSIENQECADERIQHLLKVPWRTRFLSVEPMLGPVNLNQALYPAQCTLCFGDPFYKQRENGFWYCPQCGDGQKAEDGRIEWVICGGESGPGFREMRIEWANDLFMQCRDADVPFYMKQMGGHPNKRDRMEDFPSGLRVQEFPR